MTILRQINFASGTGADRWIGGGIKDGFEALGHQCFFLTYDQDLESRVNEVRPAILLIAQDRLTRATVPVLKKIRASGTKVFLWVDSMIGDDLDLVEIIKNEDPADIYHGETEIEWMKTFTELTGKPYHLIANAANAKYHTPTTPVAKYECDIAYLGANLPLKRAAFARLLLPLKKKYNVKIYGPGWTLKDGVLRFAAVAARKLGMTKVNDMLSNARITVPPEEERQLYSSAKISLNIHEAREGRTAQHMILNERTFKIPACGGFEICDNVPALRNYFAEEEMAMARSDAEWFSNIDYYMIHEDERRAMRDRATEKVLREHTYKNRAEQIIQLSGL